jgi:hypothetical protein
MGRNNARQNYKIYIFWSIIIYLLYNGGVKQEALGFPSIF